MSHLAADQFHTIEVYTMTIIDETVLLPPPPPAPVGMPYEVEDVAFGTFGRTRPVKKYADGRTGGYLQEDELGVLAVVRHLEGQVAGTVPLDAPEPPLPYDARPYPFGYGPAARERFAKVYPPEASRIGGHFLEDDEIQAFEFLQALREQVAAKRASTPTGEPKESIPAAELAAPNVEVKEVAPTAEPAPLLAVSESPGGVQDASEPEGDDEPTGEPVGAQERAGAFLRELLKDGPVPAAVAFEKGAEAGFSEKSLKRGKAAAGITSRKVGLSGWLWELPTAEPADDVGTLARLNNPPPDLNTAQPAEVNNG